MDKLVERSVNKAVDSIQQRLTSYACGLNYDGLSREATHATKVRVIDTLGALIGGFHGEPCHIARNIAAQMLNPDGATVIGTRMKTTPDMAAFVNATTARYVEMNDTYHRSGVFGAAQLQEIEVNPLIVLPRGQGVAAVDVLVKPLA